MASKCIFVGYSENVKGFRVWFLETDRVDIRRDVIFNGSDNPADIDTKIEGEKDSQFIECNETPQIIQIHSHLLVTGNPDVSIDGPEENSEKNNDFESANNSFESTNNSLEAHPETSEAQELELDQPYVRVLRDRDRLRKPIRHPAGVNSFSALLAENVQTNEEPQSYQEAMTS